MDFGTVLLIMLGGAAIFEGLLYALIPDKMLGLMRELSHMPPKQLHIFGTVSVAVGVGLVVFALR